MVLVERRIAELGLGGRVRRARWARVLGAAYATLRAQVQAGAWAPVAPSATEPVPAPLIDPFLERFRVGAYQDAAAMRLVIDRHHTLIEGAAGVAVAGDGGDITFKGFRDLQSVYARAP